MTLTSILLFTAFAVLFRLLARPQWKGWLLYAASILAVYWLQPASPVRYLDFWLPTLTLALAVMGWALTRPVLVPGLPRPVLEPGLPRQGTLAPPPAVPTTLRASLPAAVVLAVLMLMVGLTRFLDVTGLIIPSRPPAFEQVLAALGVVTGLALGLGALAGRTAAGKKFTAGLLWGAVALLVLLLVLLKTPPLAAAVSVVLRGLMNQSSTLAAAGDLRWLGFSYVAFRLIHTLRDRQNGRLPAVSLQEYLVYVIFFPAFTAGPIDRLERFIKDLRASTTRGKPALAAGNNPDANPRPAAGMVLPQNWPDWAAAGQRLALGLLKKFVVADSLALVALNPSNAAQSQSAGWTWVLLIAYSLQIFFDFSGYTDIAIGLGRLLGISLPENFNAPYLKSNLTLFWNSWHMTLTNWFRAYYFNPITRWLRTIKLPSLFSRPGAGSYGRNSENGGNAPAGLAPRLIIFVTQLSTFVLIGLWHGVTWNFVLWGVWHGVGLFAQNRWSEAMRPRYASLDSRPRLHQAVTLLSTCLTFLYVSLGWVFFALPEPALSFGVLGRLFSF